MYIVCIDIFLYHDIGLEYIEKLVDDLPLVPTEEPRALVRVTADHEQSAHMLSSGGLLGVAHERSYPGETAVTFASLSLAVAADARVL